jgi:toxin ParE1/3/4
VKVEISTVAKSDLRDAFVCGLEKYGRVAAHRYLDELLNRIGTLSEFPLRYSERKDIDPPVRVIPHKGHVVLYRVGEDQVAILRVVSRFRDWSHAL